MICKRKKVFKDNLNLINVIFFKDMQHRLKICAKLQLYFNVKPFLLTVWLKDSKMCFFLIKILNLFIILFFFKICYLTNIESDVDAMIALCDKTNNDIRSSMNTLQFLSKRTNRITAKIINELNIGQKDVEKGIFTIMSEIFFRKNEKK